jgi:hypothetical protein
MRTIRLTRGKVAIVDADLYPSLSRVHWYAVYRSRQKTWYAQRSFWRGGHVVTEKLHRVVMRLRGDDVAHRQVRHRSRNGLDCRYANLRMTERMRSPFRTR